MPEGDTIYRTARALQKVLAGKVINAFETGFAKLASVNDDTPVVGRVVEKVEARGKWCLIFLSGDLILLSHMLMSGTWHIYRVGEKWTMPRRAMRVMIRVAGLPTHAPGAVLSVLESKSVSGFEAVLFNAQIAEFHTARSLERSSQVRKLGPDVLAKDFSVEAGVRALRERAASHAEDEIAVVLLNQRVIAGLGNVYKSEVAFTAGVNPFRQMSTITEFEMEAIVQAAMKYMKANVQDAGPRGETGEGIVTYSGPRRTTRAMDSRDRVWVYRRQGQECRRCGTAIMMRKQGEQARSTYWCPQCQPYVAA